MSDVAARAGVSRSAVSIVLNGRTTVRLAASTAERVRTAARELDYRPNRQARNLRLRRSGQLAVHMSALDSADSPFALTLLWPLLQAAERAGFHVVTFAGPHDSIATVNELINTGSADAFILTESTIADPRAAALAARGFPFVSYGRLDATLPQAWVDMDNGAATQLLVERFLAEGARTMAFLAPPTRAYWHRERRDRFRRCLRGAGRPAALALTVDNDAAGVARQLDGVLARPGPHALIVSPHRLAAVVTADLRRRGLTIGREVSIGVFDAPPTPWMGDPAIVTASVPAAVAADALLERCLHELQTGPNDEPGRYLPPSLGDR